ncbi:MAG: helix-turn-helix transcriptional regulator [Propionicimonas sp.]
MSVLDQIPSAGRSHDPLVRLLRVREVADLLGISVWQVDELRRTGLLRSVSVGSRTHRYHPDDVTEFVRRRRG